LEPSGPVQACNGIALRLLLHRYLRLYTKRERERERERVCVCVGGGGGERPLAMFCPFMLAPTCFRLSLIILNLVYKIEILTSVTVKIVVCWDVARVF